jgi:hypothetical protein
MIGLCKPSAWRPIMATFCKQKLAGFVLSR